MFLKIYYKNLKYFRVGSISCFKELVLIYLHMYAFFDLVPTYTYFDPHSSFQKKTRKTLQNFLKNWIIISPKIRYVGMRSRHLIMFLNKFQISSISNLSCKKMVFALFTTSLKTISVKKIKLRLAGSTQYWMIWQSIWWPKMHR